jgi:hypothetical protein
VQTVGKAARFVHPLGAAGVVALVFLQVYLIAAYIFGDSGGAQLARHSRPDRRRARTARPRHALVGWWGQRYEIAISRFQARQIAEEIG